MENRTRTSVFIEIIDSIQLIKSNNIKETDVVALNTGNTTLFIDERPLEIKVGNNKVKVSVLDFMKAFKDMLDTGEFYMDQIDESVWDIEKKLEDSKNTLAEIRGDS